MVYYCILTNKMNTEKTLFVFYTLDPSSKGWEYNKLPKGWWWVGGGSTSPVVTKPQNKLKYEREEQFSGPAETKQAMIEYLDGVFAKLKQEGAVKIYKIRQSYLP
jgi:hypothetical protein